MTSRNILELLIYSCFVQKLWCTITYSDCSILNIEIQWHEKGIYSWCSQWTFTILIDCIASVHSFSTNSQLSYICATHFLTHKQNSSQHRLYIIYYFTYWKTLALQASVSACFMCICIVCISWIAWGILDILLLSQRWHWVTWEGSSQDKRRYYSLVSHAEWKV